MKLTLERALILIKYYESELEKKNDRISELEIMVEMLKEAVKYKKIEKEK